MAIDQAKNAALYAISILSIYDEEIAIKLSEYRQQQTKSVIDDRKLSL